MIIYIARNIQNNKVYIGQTTLTLEKRIQMHYVESRKKKSNITYFHKALLKYKKESFKWSVIEDNIDNIDELNKREIYYIAKYHANDRHLGYNIKEGGNGGGANTIETRKKIGEKTKERWKNPSLAKRMKKGLEKGVKTVIKNAETYFEKRICVECGKYFYVKPHYPKKTCSEKCCREYRKNHNKGFDVAIEKNKSRQELFDAKIKSVITQWSIDNKDEFVCLKKNKLTRIFDNLKTVTNLKDERSIMRPFGYSSRKDFVAMLSNMYAELRETERTIG